MVQARVSLGSRVKGTDWRVEFRVVGFWGSGFRSFIILGSALISLTLSLSLSLSLSLGLTQALHPPTLKLSAFEYIVHKARLQA